MCMVIDEYIIKIKNNNRKKIEIDRNGCRKKEKDTQKNKKERRKRK